MPQPHKEAAMEFLRLAASGRVREAYQKHVAAGFRHHNPYFRGDAESLAAGMAENCAKFPDKKLEIQRAIEESDLVAVHSRVRMKPGDADMAVVHIFRFKADLITELWDVGAPENSPNEHGMF